VNFRCNCNIFVDAVVDSDNALVVAAVVGNCSMKAAAVEGLEGTKTASPR